jgi:hypothetical protein
MDRTRGEEGCTQNRPSYLHLGLLDVLCIVSYQRVQEEAFTKTPPRQLDRGNISQALSDNLLKDLKLNTNGQSWGIIEAWIHSHKVADYNTGMTLFYVSFLSAEIPSQLISKKLGPDRWIPVQMIAWSLVASLQSLLTGKTSFFITRVLLGLIEGGFIPDTILYLSYFYKSVELPVRLSFFWTAYQSTQIVSAFLAYGILRLRGHNGLEGWRWLFALEGALTGLIGIITFFYLPPSPTQTASKFRGKDGWFNEHEEKIMVNRILRDDPSKGDMHNRQGLSFRALWAAFTDYHLWPIYLIGLTWLIPNNPMQAYLTLNIRALGFDTFKTNLLTIPAYVLFIAQLIFWTWLSEKINQRFLVGLISQIWSLPLLIALAVIPAKTNIWAKWTISILLVGHPYAHAIIVAITSRNAGSVRTRTVASAAYNMCVQTSSIIASNVRVLLNLSTWFICAKCPHRSIAKKTSHCIERAIGSSLEFASTIFSSLSVSRPSMSWSTDHEQRSGMLWPLQREMTTWQQPRMSETRDWISDLHLSGDRFSVPGE